MSDTNADQQEPSMEEILASIRRIISEDGDEEPEGEAVAANPDADDTPVEALNDDNEAPDGDVEDDILVLTDVIEDGEPEPEAEPDSEGELAPEIERVDDYKLVSDEVEEVSAASMSGLTAALAANAAIGDGNQTLEHLVKDVLRPILKEWLDENLPDIVDRLVHAEV